MFACAGCASDYNLDRRYGPSPILQASQVEASVSNQVRILNALATDANIPAGTPYFYYNVAEAGFNFVDDECTAYFNTLFFLDRGRERYKNTLLTAAQTTNAILSVTGAATKTLAIVAQAFGLGVNMTDIVADTYLYQLPPAVTLGFVKELQLAYRNGAAARRTDINSPIKAYTQVQEYLSLCLPPTIESRLVEVIKAARAFPDPITGANRSTFGLNIGSMPVASRPQLEEAINRTVLPSATMPIEPGLQKPAGPTQSEVTAYQRALCVEADGKVGEKTQQAIRDYLKGLESNQQASTPEIRSREARLLRDAATQIKDCKGRGFKSAYEVGAFGVSIPGWPDSRTRIQDLQTALRKVVPALPVTGTLDSETRAAIRAFRKSIDPKDEKGDEIDEGLLLQIFS